ncbi:MAG: mechanosensitive ion channel [Bryobacterales bacterium]|nr:mechanosensitive ion channel [Bryobacterales bacterium]
MQTSRSGSRWIWLLAIPITIVVVLIGLRLMQHDEVSGTVEDLGQFISDVLLKPYFQVGEISVSPIFLIQVVLFLAVLVVAARTVDSVLRTRILVRTAMDAGQRYALARVASYSVFVVGLVVGLQSIGLNLNTLTVFGGALGIGIGFGLQNLTNNFVSGLILLAERPVKVGDRVEVDGLNGDVVRIGARSTWVRTNDNVVIIIPNSDFTENRVTNWTAHERRVRFSVPVGVSYSSDPEQVREILMKAAVDHPDVLTAPAPDVVFVGFGDSSLDFELRVWTETKVQVPKILRSDLYFRIFRAFRDNGVEIPFPQRDLHLRSSDLPWLVPEQPEEDR